MQAILSDIEPGGVILDEGDAFTFPGSTGHTFRVPAGAGPARVL